MNFLTELTEARLFRYEGNLGNKTARELGEMLFMSILCLEMLRYLNEPAARAYASQTLRFNEFDKMRPSTTDLANLIAVLSNQDDYKEQIDVDKKISPPVLQLRTYFRNMINGGSQHAINRSMLLKLESYLGIQAQDLRQVRRVVGDWADHDKTQHNLAFRQLVRDISARSPLLDILTMVKSHY
jgi:hypothetical protein